MPRTIQTTAAHEPVGDHSSGDDISSTVTLSPPAGATHIMLQTVTQNARYRLDGTNPTTSVGFQLRVDEPPQLIRVPSDGDIRVIEEAASASIQYQWVK